MKKAILLFYPIFLLCEIAFAQFPGGFGGGGSSAPKIYDGKVSGVVIEKLNGKPIEFANIALYKTGSDKPEDGTVTDDKGLFKIKNIKNGNYRITVTFIGFETRSFDSLEITDKKTSVDLGKITLDAGKTLKEVNVEEEKQLIETRIDKLIYNADKDITSKGGNATDVLRKVPMVTVDLDGNVMLQGTNNVKILINDKPSSIMAGTVGDAMKMIPADEIEKVEVITSPSAKYDAEGTGGIINIITKKKNIEGLSGMVNFGVGTRSSNLFGNFSYRQGRFGTGLNLGGFGYTGTGNLTSTRTSNDSLVFEQTGKNTNLGFGPFVQWTTDLDLNSKNNLSTSVKFFGFFNRVNGDNDTKLYGNSFKAENKTNIDGINYDASLDYKRKFKKPEQEFSMSVQHTNNTRSIDYEIKRLYDSGNSFSSYETSNNDNINRETTFQTDYTHPFSKMFTLEAGGKAILRDVTSDATTNLDNNGVIPDVNSTNEFNYLQNVYAGYAVGSLTLKKFGLKLGGRYEQTNVDGDQGNDTTVFSGNYSNLIPSATLSYRKAGKYQVKVSYTQRIQRPGMTYLNPYRNNSDISNTTYGNPNLDAETSNNFEFGYSIFRKFGSVNSSIYHRFTNNAIEKYSFVNGSSGLFETTYGNIGKNNSTGGSIGLNVLYKKLILSLNTNVYYYEVKSTQQELKLTNNGVNYSVSLFGSLKFTDRWGVQAFGNFSGPKYSVQGYSTSFFYYNLSARREFKNGKGGVGIGLDNFATPYLHFKSVYNGNGFSYKTDNKIFFMGVRLSLDYRFGKMEFGNSKKKIKNDDLKPGDEGGVEGGMGGK
ncbi:MAG: TonB-dependent receptor [Bacteroidetes bacterium]|nr:TonB-dependent receptor [Bacteroidota bacterium]